MASFSSINDESDSIEHKPNTKDEKQTLDDLKKRAFVPDDLPEDFLRVIQNEDTDSLLAQQLHYDLNKPRAMPAMPVYAVNYYNQPQPRIDYGRGKLQIDVVEAKLNKNYGLVRMDPYVRIIIGNKIFETPTAPSGSKNPVWRKSMYCNLPHNVDTMVIEVYDEKSFTEDELIAFVKYPLPNSLFDGIFIDEWIPLSGKLGEQKEGYINIHLLFTPVENLNVENQRSRNPVRQSIDTVSPSSSSSSSSSTSPNSRSNPINQPSSVHLPPELTESTRTAITTTNAARNIEDDLKAIKEMFPTFDEDVVKSIYESSNFNKDSTIEALLQMAADA